MNTNSEKYSSRFFLKNQDESKKNETNIQSPLLVETVALTLFESNPKQKTKTNNKLNISKWRNFIHS